MADVLEHDRDCGPSSSSHGAARKVSGRLTRIFLHQRARATLLPMIGACRGRDADMPAQPRQHLDEGEGPLPQKACTISNEMGEHIGPEIAARDIENGQHDPAIPNNDELGGPPVG